jgi:hypothetical protein
MERSTACLVRVLYCLSSAKQLYECCTACVQVLYYECASLVLRVCVHSAACVCPLSCVCASAVLHMSECCTACVRVLSCVCALGIDLLSSALSTGCMGFQRRALHQAIAAEQIPGTITSLLKAIMAFNQSYTSISFTSIFGGISDITAEQLQAMDLDQLESIAVRCRILSDERDISGLLGLLAEHSDFLVGPEAGRWEERTVLREAQILIEEESRARAYREHLVRTALSTMQTCNE